MHNVIEDYRNTRALDKVNDESKNQDIIFKNFEKEISKTKNELETNITLYKLYFSKIKITNSVEECNCENIKMHNLADNLLEEIDILELERKKDVTEKYDDKIALSFINETSNYLKREWDKAKDNE